MKARVQTDIALLVVVIILTAIFYLSPQFHTKNFLFDIVLDFFGFVSILKGTALRMVARGHKKAYSQKSQSLVTTGIYALIRNPMYLGTLMIGMGFVLILWPWWAVPFFVVVFYLRFKRQMAKEERFLLQTFGTSYEQYCAQTPRLFPSFKTMFKLRVRDMVHLKETFSTKERWGLISWPLLAFILASAQKKIMYGYVDFHSLGRVLATAFITFMAGFILKYWLR